MSYVCRARLRSKLRMEGYGYEQVSGYSSLKLSPRSKGMGRVVEFLPYQYGTCWEFGMHLLGGRMAANCIERLWLAAFTEALAASGIE